MMVMQRTVARILSALVIVAGIGAFPASSVAAEAVPGVQNVTAVAQVTATESVVIVSWTPATPQQRQGLSWTAIRFGPNPQPILVFSPTVSDVPIPDVAPGTYDVSVEFDYGPRSHFTHATPGRTRVTVPRYVVPVAAPLAPTAVTATATGQNVTMTWKHNPAERADQHPDAYVITLGERTVAVVRGYASRTGTFTDVAAGTHPVTVTARNSEGDSPTVSGPPVTVTVPGTPAGRAGASIARRSSDLINLGVAIIVIALLAGVTVLARSLVRDRHATVAQ
jgi:hypothetical protein